MSSDAAPPPNKRRRATLACRSCRHRKSRCSGDRPCAQCKDLGFECVYGEGSAPSSLTVGKSYVTKLEQRLHDMEAAIRQLQQHRHVSFGSMLEVSGGGDDRTDSETIAVADDDQPIGHAGHTPTDRGTSQMGEIDISENSIDGMGAIKFTDEEDCGYFGPSSNIAFMRHISRAILKSNPYHPSVTAESPQDQRGGGMVNVTRSRPPSPVSKHAVASGGVNIFALPSHDRTWSLIRQYFHKTGQLLPYIHEASFCETYFQMKRENFTRVRRTWLGLLNIVMAIAASLSTDGDMPAEQRIQESDIYYQRANGLCDKDSKRNASLEMVQYLLILGQYLQGTQKSVQAWTTHGLAISAAYQLGLHSPDANKGFPPLESEIRKRTWFGCVLLDRTLSMTFGRPCTIPETHVKLDMPLQDLQMLNHTQETEVHPQLDGCFFTATIKLYVVLYNVLDSCYDQNLGFEHPSTTLSAISQILEGERQLDQWRLQLSTLGLRVWEQPLRTEDVQAMQEDSVIRHRFSIVLSVRYHNLRILLYRRRLESLLRALGGHDETAPDQRLMQSAGITSVQNCVDSAIAIISAVHTITLSTGWRRELLGAWNYSLYYTFNAGLVIFAAILIASKDSSHDPSAGEMGDRSRPFLDMAAEALRRLDAGNRVIERCADYLSQLSLILNASSMYKGPALYHCRDGFVLLSCRTRVSTPHKLTLSRQHSSQRSKPR
ncbi:hypothetical protein DL546_004088 [Coniochaeta pulveracea]|uniref:Zn(2)-C6 fungal-type domain-containing protein n=1 Tax=Coniochaeta pulveracea TaxID=177199 RepID=A0A420XZA1_9PEZI|nr:hypothetical protein DL546_004088 [Coniochaeta pulveracea]